RLVGLEILAGEAAPALQRVVVPGAAGHVVVAVQVAVGENVEAGAFLVAEDGGQGVLEFLAEAHIHETGIQGPAPHAEVEPAWARPRAGNGTRKNPLCSDSEHSPLGSPGSGLAQEGLR